MDKPEDEIIAQHRAPQPRVDPVQRAAVTREEVARILEPGIAFDHALAQVAER